MKQYIGYADGASSGNPGDAGIGIVLLEDGKEILRLSKFIGKATNNEAEYISILTLLSLLVDHKIKDIKIFTDSELMVKQFAGDDIIKDEKLKELYDKIMVFGREIKFTIEHVDKEKNGDADKLAKQGSKRGGKLKNV
jgi:ribonuclease HI